MFFCFFFVFLLFCFVLFCFVLFFFVFFFFLGGGVGPLRDRLLVFLPWLEGLVVSFDEVRQRRAYSRFL